MQDTRYKIQDTRYKIQDTRYKIQDTRYKIQDTRCRIWEGNVISSQQECNFLLSSSYPDILQRMNSCSDVGFRKVSIKPRVDIEEMRWV